jgi:hypothetical protein
MRRTPTVFVVLKREVKEDTPSPPRSRHRTDDIVIRKSTRQPLPPRGHIRFRRPREEAPKKKPASTL